MSQIHINETNVQSYVGQIIRAEKNGEVLQGKIVGLSDCIVADRNGQPVRPITIEERTRLVDFHPADGWKVTVN